LGARGRKVTRRAFLLGAWGAGTLGALAACEVGVQQVLTPPNILLLITDDLTAHIAYADGVMPNLQRRLIERGIRFDRAYCHVPLCGPASAAIYSGKGLRRTGVDRNGAAPDIWRKSGSQRDTLATACKARGYAVGHFGKYMVYRGKEDPPNSRGLGYVPPGYDRWVERLGKKFSVQGDYPADVLGVGDGVNGTRYITDECIKFIDAHAGVPWHAAWFVTNPHDPYTPTRESADLYGSRNHRNPAVNEPDMSDKLRWMRNLPPVDRDKIRETYRGKLRESWDADVQIGRLLDTLESTGQLANTVILFTSDNGYMMGEHRLTAKDQPYEQSARIPLVVSGPGVAVGARNPALVSHLDVRPTLEAFADPSFVGERPGLDGRNLKARLASNDFSSASPRRRILVEGSYAEIRGENPGGAYNPPGTWDMLRQNGYMLNKYARGTREMYDLSKDPWENNNIIKSVSSRLVDSLTDRLDAMKSSLGDRMRSLEED
jgi:N-acetylglucosamine-6-sulfatase